MKGRIRTHKPELFKHWLLWHIGQVTGFPLAYWYEGIWCYTDRRGRFEWSPRRLKSEIAPHDDVDFEHALNALANTGHIIKYEAEDRLYGYIPRFLHHQSPNGQEHDSVLPPAPRHIIDHERLMAKQSGQFEKLTKAELIAAPVVVSRVASVSAGNDLETRLPHVDDVSPLTYSILSHSVESSEEEQTTKPVGKKSEPSNLPAITGPKTSAAIVQRMSSVFAEIAEGQRAHLSVEQVRKHQAEMIFLYWTAKFKHERAVLDKKREAKIVQRLKENGGDVGELLYALDGAHRDSWIMGTSPKSEGKVYDDIITILRDRSQIERFARTCKGFRDEVPHKLIPRLEGVLRGDGEVLTPSSS